MTQQRWEGDAGNTEGPPPPLRADGARLVDELAAALESAVASAVLAAALPEPYVLCLGKGPTDRWSAWPWVEIGARAFRDTVTAIRDGEDIAVNRLHDGFDSGGTAWIDLTEFLDDSARLAWRELRAPADTETEAESERCRTIQRTLEAELTRRLNATPPPDAADPFLALVSFNLLADTTPQQQRDFLPDTGAYERPWQMATHAVGAKRVDAFRRSVRGHAPAPPVGDPLTDRGALAALLAARGIPEAEAAEHAGHAEVVLDLITPPRTWRRTPWCATSGFERSRRISGWTASTLRSRRTRSLGEDGGGRPRRRGSAAATWSADSTARTSSCSCCRATARWAS